MKDKVHALHGVSYEFAIENRADDELAAQPGQIVFKTAAQVIKDAHFRQILEVFGDVPAYETGASCHQDSHTGRAQRKAATD
jgi:hypothetical protein